MKLAPKHFLLAFVSVSYLNLVDYRGQAINCMFCYCSVAFIKFFFYFEGKAVLAPD